MAFGADGVSVGTGGFNYSGDLFVAWNWKAAGGGEGTSNTDGGITSTVSVNTTAKFSIVKWAGSGQQDTVGHGLGVAPDMVIIKDLTGTSAWIVWTPTLTNGGYRMELNETSAQHDSNWSGVDTVPTAAYFNVANNSIVNASGRNYIAYCWKSIEGYSKSGTYTGNGRNNSGTFVYTGFRPAWVMLKAVSASGSWPMVDIERNEIGSSSTAGHNGTVPRLRANTAGIEDDDNRIDMVSNGFHINVNYAESNGDGVSYLYLAFAKGPFKTSRAR